MRECILLPGINSYSLYFLGMDSMPFIILVRHAMPHAYRMKWRINTCRMVPSPGILWREKLNDGFPMNLSISNLHYGFGPQQAAE